MDEPFLDHAADEAVAEKPSQMRSVPPTAKPFLVLLAAWVVIAGALVALSIFEGGCQSAPAQVGAH